VRRLFHLSTSELLLLTEVFILVAAIRAALWIYPFDRVRRHLQKPCRLSRSKPSSARLAQFVSVASRVIPKANCLTCALAAEALLTWHGYDACLRIGVSRNASNGILAHAWVESDGYVLIGAEAVKGLTLLRPAGA